MKHVKGPPSRLLFKFCSGTHGLLEEMDRHAKGGACQDCPNCGACKESFSMFFLSVHHDSQRQNFHDYEANILSLGTAAFSIKQCFIYIGEKQGMLMNGCSSWYK